ncbi:hypothetical protein CW712_05630 [Candidatus Bathyarchaeota archaeon]|nr:MAG: hypothetical protein CW712_05630 [Candidatus Bathyarchaeota archaeon]
MPLKLKVFGPYGLMPRVGEKLEDDFNSWAEKSGVDLKNVKPVTANLPDRTMVLLVFYRS